MFRQVIKLESVSQPVALDVRISNEITPESSPIDLDKVGRVTYFLLIFAAQEFMILR